MKNIKIKCPVCGSDNIGFGGGFYYNKNGIKKRRYQCLNPNCPRKRFIIKDVIEEETVPEQLRNKLINLLKNGKYTIERLNKVSGVAIEAIKDFLDELVAEKYNLHCNKNNEYTLLDQIERGSKQVLNIEYWKGERIKLGLIADTHLCSKYERLEALNCIYDIFADENIEIVYHGGNYIDGENIYNKYEIHTAGVTPQVEYFIKNYPQREGIITKFIVGDDHEGWYIARERLNIGEYTQMKAEQSGRKDLEYIGYIEADIYFEGINGGSWMRVMHGGGGSAYALSYTPQKIVESLQGGEKPRILLLGHYHKLDWCFPREVHCIQMGCFQEQTPWMRKRKMQAHVGGEILELILAPDGTINRVRLEYITFFDKGFYIGKNKYWK